MSETRAPYGQAKYQVRLDWGATGAERIVPGAHVAVVVDVLPSPDGEAIAAALAGRDLVVLEGSLRNRSAVARRILELQEERGERLMVAIVAAGERTGGRAGSEVGGSDAHSDAVRFAVEDQLGAGAIVDALIALGIDHTSPEAAVACAAFEGLRHAAVHLIGASASGAELVAQGRRPEVRAATEVDASDEVPSVG
ncbi:2-phosphosulfolactate phosphatase [Agromyces mariniharenae]|uniref:Probable 2-phosphosulfolactate phosphatase n=1 Tax=Agromyces mariniharenae TaxID=2604423 RepID=A0A5S4V525_9MICO|nr:2-phosphosulfolactate phosphatase [Agromyces mariniharenae]TYL54237.1 2-phosphosulfolactate phosphatase [Agromyces mariniharenae]